MAAKLGMKRRRRWKRHVWAGFGWLGKVGAAQSGLDDPLAVLMKIGMCWGVCIGI